MKKLVFCILFIIVIIGSLALPTFAEDPIPYQIPLSNLINSSTDLTNNGSYSTLERSLGSISITGFTAVYQGIIVSPLNNTLGGKTYIISFSAKSSVSGPCWLCFYNTNNEYFSSCTRYPDLTDSYQLFTYEISIPSTYNLTYCMIRLQTSGRTDIYIKDFNIFDVTDTGYTVDQLSQYGVFDSTFTGQFARIPGFFNPLLDFYLSFFHLFDWIPEILSTYSAPFVFCVISLSVLLIVFIIVCIIRRCRSS